MITPTINYPMVFAPSSTMLLDGVVVPADAFLGNCVYTHGTRPMPWHLGDVTKVATILDIPKYVLDANKSAKWNFDTGVTYLWDVVDSSGTVFATAVFNSEVDNGNTGDIVDIDGFYAGCIKGSTTNNNGQTVYGIKAILAGVVGTLEVDPDAFVFDICSCYELPEPVPQSSEDVGINSIVLPSNYSLKADSVGLYYITSASKTQSTDNFLGLQKIQIVSSGVTSGGAPTESVTELTGEHVVITPGSVSVSEYFGSGTDTYPDGDLRVVVNDNTLLIGNRGGLATVL